MCIGKVRRCFLLAVLVIDGPHSVNHPPSWQSKPPARDKYLAGLHSDHHHHRCAVPTRHHNVRDHRNGEPYLECQPGNGAAHRAPAAT